jgi:hypothetical protein
VNVAEMLNHGFDEPVDPYQRYLLAEGYDGVFASEYPRSVHDANPMMLPDEAYQDNWIGRQAERLLREAPQDRPWFCQVNFVKPHNPWDVTSGTYRRPPQADPRVRPLDKLRPGPGRRRRLGRDETPRRPQRAGATPLRSSSG